MTDSDCTRRGEGPIPNRYRAPYSNLPPNLEQDETIGNVTPVYPQQRNDQCPVDCPTLMVNTDMETIDIDDIVAIPLDIQERIFDQSVSDAFGVLTSLVQLHDWTYGGAWDEEASAHNVLVDLALTRLRSGFEQYHSEMFTWTPERRRREVLEELADALVYLVSGAIE